MEVKIREARPEDADSLAEAVKKSWLEAYRDVLTEDEFRETKSMDDFLKIEDLKESFEEDDSFYLVAVVDDKVIGQMVFAWGDDTHDWVESDDTVQLRSTYIHPNYWRSGIGTRLFEKGLEKLPPRFNVLKVEVLRDNKAGKNFYEKLGFTPEREHVLNHENIPGMAKDRATVILSRPRSLD